MSAVSQSSVEFSESGAIYRPGNGHVIEYRKVNGIYYHKATPDVVVQALEQARARRQRIRIYLGDVTTGRDWLEEHDIEGTIGNSMGPLRIPLLIHSRRSHGGPALLDHCIIRIKRTTGGVLYQHPTYYTGMFTIRQINPDDAIGGEKLQDHGLTHAVLVNGQRHANFRSLKLAERYVRRMTQ